MRTGRVRFVRFSTSRFGFGEKAENIPQSDHVAIVPIHSLLRSFVEMLILGERRRSIFCEPLSQIGDSSLNRADILKFRHYSLSAIPGVSPIQLKREERTLETVAALRRKKDLPATGGCGVLGLLFHFLTLCWPAL
jgi:hypothetical protein